jgi:hypothetical protein
MLPARADGPQPPDWRQYTVEFKVQAPGSGSEAVQTTPVRARSIIQHSACGGENEFLSLAAPVVSGQDETQGRYDGLLRFVMAKLAWLALGNGDCSGTFNVVFVKGDESDFFNATNQTQFDNLNNFMSIYTDPKKGGFGIDCNPPFGRTSFSFQPAQPPNAPFLTVQATVTMPCLRAQMEAVLPKLIQGDAQPGTSGLPCNIATPDKISDILQTLEGLIVGNPANLSYLTTVGDWDFKMKALIRILFLDITSRGEKGAPLILSPQLRHHILYDLISISGGPGPDSYSWLDCGDNEKDTGSAQDDTSAAQDLEDENSSSSADNFFDSIGDIFSWFLKRLIEFVVLAAVAASNIGTAGVAATVAAILAALTPLDGSGLVGLGLAGTLLGQIPETENHRLMIESTRFLKNQLVIATLQGNGKDASNLIGKQQQVKNWLLQDFQRIAKTEFTEYNSRPYYGFAQEALRNLADFATDADVKTGAQMLIEYSAAKFAVGSNQGRRLVPFRRHFGVVACLDGNPCADENGKDNNVAIEIFRGFTQGSGWGDSAVTYGLLFNGQTQQLPFGNIPKETADDAVPAATTRFIPHGLIAQYAIRKQDFRYFQRLHYDGYEAYSSSPSALITAGGLQTDHAYKFQGVPTVLVTGVVDALGTELQDRGAAVPTTVMFTGAPVTHGDTGRTTSRMALDHFISFRGTRQDQGGDEGFNDNLCVWLNFVCGTNMRVPGDIVQCLIHDPNHVGLRWYFLDSSICDGYKTGPRFFVVMYVICPQDICRSDLQNAGAGFLEVIDNPSDPIGAFEFEVIKRNPPSPELANLGQGCLTSNGACTGHYHTMSTPVSHNLELALRGHQDDSNRTGILSVDGVAEKTLDQMTLAESDTMLASPPISSKGDGVITIANAITSQILTLDFSDVNHPCRRVGLIGSPGDCVQQ